MSGVGWQYREDMPACYRCLMALETRRVEIDRALPSRSPLSDREWGWLQEKGYTDDAEWSADGGGAAYAAAQIREFRGIYGPAKRAPAQPKEEPAPPGWQRARLRNLARLYAQLAEQDPSVQRLRARTGTCGRRKGPELETLAAWITERYYTAWGIEPDADSATLSAAISQRVSSGRKHLELFYRDDGAVQVVAVPATSLVGEVATVAANLSDQFRWNHWDATRWVTCGGDPPRPWVFRWKPDLRGLHRGEVTDTTTRLTIEVDPTLTPGEVAAAYGRARSAIFRGARVRAVEEKAQALVRFAVAQPENIEDAPWDEWLRRWNAGPGRRHGKYDSQDYQRWNFRREVRKAWVRLTRVGWGLPRGSG